MITLLMILMVSSILLTIIVYINEKIITKLSNNSKFKKFWKKHICEEFEN